MFLPALYFWVLRVPSPVTFQTDLVIDTIRTFQNHLLSGDMLFLKWLILIYFKKIISNLKVYWRKMIKNNSDIWKSWEKNSNQNFSSQCIFLSNNFPIYSNKFFKLRKINWKFRKKSECKVLGQCNPILFLFCFYFRALTTDIYNDQLLKK